MCFVIFYFVLFHFFKNAGCELLNWFYTPPGHPDLSLKNTALAAWASLSSSGGLGQTPSHLRAGPSVWHPQPLPVLSWCLFCGIRAHFPGRPFLTCQCRGFYSHPCVIALTTVVTSSLHFSVDLFIVWCQQWNVGSVMVEKFHARFPGDTVELSTLFVEWTNDWLIFFFMVGNFLRADLSLIYHSISSLQQCLVLLWKWLW